MSSSTMSDPYRNFSIFHHRPHKTLKHMLNALAATAVYRIWFTLLFMGGWSSMVVLVNQKTAAKLEFPNTMITVLGVVLGLTLSYRTSSAYEKYSEGRKMWSLIICASRQWARVVWHHCPETMVLEPPTDPNEVARDKVRTMVEKKTMVQMATAFAIAVKHYLRGEEGICYEDLYHLVSFIPGLDLPSAMPEAEANMTLGLPSMTGARGASYDTASMYSSSTYHATRSSTPPLRPAEDAPKFKLNNLLPRWTLSPNRRNENKSRPEHAPDSSQNLGPRHSGRGQNVPLEIIMFMSSWVAALQKRKTIDVPTANCLLLHLNQFNDSLVALERILTTPIPWSYDAHIWEVTWIYVLALPFQLYASNFGWVTVPATVITTYIVIGYASIAEEIENPFNFDKNDLNLGFFTREIIAKELDAITAQAPCDPTEYIFSSFNRPLGRDEPAADQLATKPIQEVRGRLEMQHRRLAPGRTSTTDTLEV